MRLARPLPLAALLALAAAGPASGAALPVRVDDDFFDPAAGSVAVGDTVDWHWAGNVVNPHNVVSRRAQIDRFNSGAPTAAGGTSFSYSFKYPGRFRYLCQVHASIGMTGTITVGTDDGIPPSLTHVSLSPKLAHRRIKLSFHLSERSVIRVTLKRGTKTVRRVATVRSGGDRSVRVSLKGLKLARYAAYIQATDGWGHKSAKVKRRFRRI